MYLFKPLIFLSLLLSNYCIINVNSYGEADSYGLPIWQEREGLNLLNAVRIDPVGYKNYFMSSGYNNLGNIFANNRYPATNPVYHNTDLNLQARYHSQDMGNSNCFAHDNCDGTSISSRFNAFANGCPTGWGENLSAGFSVGIKTQNQLICETVPNCVNDGVNDGHRSNMMSPNWVAAGVGFYYQPYATYKYYWTHDYKDATCQPQTNPIYSGSHSFWPASNPMFHTTYYNKKGETLLSAKVFFSSGSSANLNLVFGSANKGYYTFQSNSYVICDSYIFEFKTSNGNVYRFPDTGSLSIVTSIASCQAWTSNYIEGSGSSIPVTTTPAPTTPAPTTPVPTTPTPTTPVPTSTPTPSTTNQPSTTTSTSTSSHTTTPPPTTSSSSSDNNNSDSNSNVNSSTNNNSSNGGGSSSDTTTSTSQSSISSSGATTNPNINNPDSKSDDGSNESNQIIPNIIVPLLLGIFIKILIL